MFRHFFKVAFRNIIKHKSFSFINIIGLAVGMAFTILILLWIQYSVSFDRFHENVDRLHIVAFTTEKEDFHSEYMVGALAEYLQEEYPEITHATRCSNTEWWRLVYQGQRHHGYGRHVDPSFFEMFSFPFIKGDPNTALSDPGSIVLTDDLAKRIFGDEDPVGKVLELANKRALVVSAIMEDVPENTQFQFEFLVPAESGYPFYNQWDMKCLKTFVMLEEHADPEIVSSRIVDIYNNHNVQDTKNNLYLYPLKDMHLYPIGGGRGIIVYIYIFSITAIAVLLMACINFMNLSTARYETRSREIGVKKIVGANRNQLIVQFVCESLLLSLIALIIAIAFVELLLPLINRIINSHFDIDYTGMTMLGLLSISLFTGMISAIYPSLFLSSFRPLAVLQGRVLSRSSGFFNFGKTIRSGTRGSAVRKGLVVIQFIISVVFIIGVLVISRQLVYARNLDMGYDQSRIIVFGMPREVKQKTEVVKNELVKHSNIEAVTVSANSLVSWQASLGIDWENKPLHITPFDMGFNMVDYDFQETFQLEMTDGRFFSREHPSDAEEAYIINEAAVRAMGETDVVGRKVTISPNSSWERKGIIIGIVKDFHTESVHKEIRPFMMGMIEQGNLMCIRIGSGGAGDAMRFIKNKVREIVPDANVYPRLLTDDLMHLYVEEISSGAVLLIMMLVAVFICIMGLVGVVAFTAERRTKEIGIRKVLGASVWGVVRMLSKDFVVLVVIANLIAWPIAYYIMNEWLQSFAYRVEIGWGTFLSAGLLALAIALVTVSTQALRAAAADPIKSLRYE